MTKKYVTFFTLFVAVFFCITSAQAQMTKVEKGNWLLGVIFKLERMRDNAIADLQRHKSEIQKCDSTIRKSENIIRLARQKGDVKAEMIAGSALAKATQAKLKNEELKNSAALRKKRVEVALANVRNLLAKQLAVKAEIRSVVTGRTGRATIFSKRLNESINLDDNRAAFLEPGDEIWTYGNSSVEMQFLDGRGTLKLGEYSRFRMEEDSQGTQIVNMIKGKIYIGVDKLDEYQKMMEDKISRYKSDAALVKDEVVGKLVEEHEKLQERMKKARKGGYSPQDPLSLWPLLPTPLVRTSGFSGAVRGTKFLVFEDEKAGSELIVLEGVVDVKAIKGDKTFPVDAGYSVRAIKDGVISKPGGGRNKVTFGAESCFLLSKYLHITTCNYWCPVRITPNAYRKKQTSISIQATVCILLLLFFGK
ncbi:MAG: hypothetical protein JRC60_03795 [Deltaproteobacteria bacterium]|nr:hypothetical protein [Deltaproteobacteria bacterium]